MNFIEICLTKGLQKAIQNLILTSKKFRQLKASKYNNCRYAYRNMTQDQTCLVVVVQAKPTMHFRLSSAEKPNSTERRLARLEALNCKLFLEIGPNYYNITYSRVLVLEQRLGSLFGFYCFLFD